jgi:phosphoribosylaminoimidazole-succinocarboxamide synthase
VLPLLYRGSVKDIYGQKSNPSLYFSFSDRYSVFDWGEMPDCIEGKGESLTSMADFFFKFLEKGQSWRDWAAEHKEKITQYPFLKDLMERGVSHHGEGIEVQEIAGEKKNVFKVQTIQVPSILNSQGEYEYSAYAQRPVQTLVPLEVIFRFGLPAGSSLFDRVKDESYLSEIGLDHQPVENEKFETPIIEFSTKLEKTDRYISYTEARDISYMNENEWNKLIELTSLVAFILKDLFEKSGIELWDGKFEFAFDEGLEKNQRDFKLVDSIGPDELRLTCNGVQLSKETLRIHYRKGEWFKKTKEAKSIALERDEKDWQKICREELLSDPENLPEKLQTIASEMYALIAEQLKTPDKKKIKNLTEKIKEFL